MTPKKTKNAAILQKYSISHFLAFHTLSVNVSFATYLDTAFIDCSPNAKSASVADATEVMHQAARMKHIFNKFISPDQLKHGQVKGYVSNVTKTSRWPDVLVIVSEQSFRKYFLVHRCQRKGCEMHKVISYFDCSSSL